MSDYRLSLKQWTDLLLPLTVKQPDVGTTPGLPVDLTAATALGSVFKGYKADTQYPFSFTFAADRTTGQLIAFMPANSVGAIPYGLYRYELKVLDALGKTLFFLEGEATVEAGRKPAHA